MNSNRVHAITARAGTLAFLLAAPAVLAAQQSLFPSDSAIREILRERVESGRAVGLVVATYEPGRPAKVFAYGTSGRTGVPLDGDAVFEIGSITKVFTATLLADMLARGEVRLDDPVAAYLPASVRMPARKGREITLLDLATHTSGLPRLPGNFRPRDRRNPYADYSVKQMYEFLSRYRLRRDIGARYEYSNLGMGLLGHALARRAGRSYEELLIERVLGPLGMRDTRMTLTPAMRGRLATGHDDSRNPVANWELPTLAGAGALRSTANDMVKFLAASLQPAGAPLHEAMALARAPRRDARSRNMRVGLGWHILAARGTSIVWHNGGTGGYRAFLGLDERRRTGVIVLANSARSADDIGIHLLNPQLPLAGAKQARAPR